MIDLFNTKLTTAVDKLGQLIKKQELDMLKLSGKVQRLQDGQSVSISRERSRVRSIKSRGRKTKQKIVNG